MSEPMTDEEIAQSRRLAKAHRNGTDLSAGAEVASKFIATLDAATERAAGLEAALREIDSCECPMLTIHGDTCFDRSRADPTYTRLCVSCIAHRALKPPEPEPHGEKCDCLPCKMERIWAPTTPEHPPAPEVGGTVGLDGDTRRECPTCKSEMELHHVCENCGRQEWPGKPPAPAERFEEWHRANCPGPEFYRARGLNPTHQHEDKPWPTGANDDGFPERFAGRTCREVYEAEHPLAPLPRHTEDNCPECAKPSVNSGEIIQRVPGASRTPAVMSGREGPRPPEGDGLPAPTGTTPSPEGRAEAVEKACHAIREEVVLPIIRVIGDMERVGYPKSETQKIRDALHRLDQSVYEVDYRGNRVKPDTSISGALEALAYYSRAKASEGGGEGE